jgi:dolichyl-phosphate beta-glucosyltransferase
MNTEPTTSPASRPSPLLSIIIPAYNEEHRLPDSMEQILAWRDTVPYRVEIIIVENGSKDRTTEIAETFARAHDDIRVIHSEKGKGVAVQTGIYSGQGDYLFICDSDLSMPIAEVEKFLPPQLEDYDVAIGSREAPGAHRFDEPGYRHLMGRVFNFIVRTLAVPGFSDTQAGFKMFKRQAALDIFPYMTITGWTFDVEALYIALKQGKKVVEVPINWYFDEDSRVDPMKDTWRMFWDVITIRRNDRRGLYDGPPLSPPPTTSEENHD